MEKYIHSKKSIILDFYKENKLLFNSSLLFGFLSIFTTILIPIFLGKFYQLAMKTDSSRGKIFDGIFGQIDDINTYFFFFGALLIIKFSLNYLQTYLIGLSGELFTKSIREKLFSTQLNTEYSSFEKKASGNYLLRYSGDLSAFNNYISKGIIGITNDILFILITLFVFYVINPKLMLIILITFPIIFSIVFFLNKKLKKYSQKRRDIRSQNLAFISSRLNAMLTLKIFNRESIEAQKFEKKSSNLFENGKSYFKWYALIDSLLPFLLYVMLGFILFASYYFNESSENKVEGAQIIIFIMLTVSSISVFKRILKVNLVWQSGNISFNKLLIIFNTPKEIKGNNELLKLETGKITFKDVDFRFNSDKLIFKNLSFTIPNYGIYSLEGDQGTGKSTLFKLLLGIYVIDKGEITIDSKNIQDFSAHSLRKNVTLVSNELSLLGKNVFECISYSRKEEKKAEALRVLISLGFFGEEEANIDYLVVDGGKNISMGQRKILLIARALLTRKKIILLDEPFSDLDFKLKNKLIFELNELASKRTIIIIDKEKRDNFEEEGIKYDGIIKLNS